MACKLNCRLSGLLLLGVLVSGSCQAQGVPFNAVGGVPAVASADAPGPLIMHSAGPATPLHLIVGQSTVLNSGRFIKRIYIGDPSVLQSFTASVEELVLTAKTPGVSSLVLWDAANQSCLYSVSADLDPSELRQSLHNAFPKADIGAEGREGRIYLTGTVPTSDMADGAVKMAALYSKEVVNSLRVIPVHGKQVQLKLRIVEVDRTRMEQYGVNIFAGGKVPFNVGTQQFASSATLGTASTGNSATVTDPLNIFLFSQALNLGATIKDLEQKQILQVLAEPTLTAISGQSAKFLSGGEFPFPVVQGGTGSAVAISIMFRPYGVKVDFTPTVNDDGTVRLKVAPEVSTLDFSNAVTISGFTIPALSTRRAETEVEIRSGESFAVSGLLDHRTIESLSQLPGISRVPLFGKLFISKAYTHSIVELVVLVTATVVDPLKEPPLVTEPHFAVPNMDANSFDQGLAKEQKIQPKKP